MVLILELDAFWGHISFEHRIKFCVQGGLIMRFRLVPPLLGIPKQILTLRVRGILPLLRQWKNAQLAQVFLDHGAAFFFGAHTSPFFDQTGAAISFLIRVNVLSGLTVDSRMAWQFLEAIHLHKFWSQVQWNCQPLKPPKLNNWC